MSYSKPHLTYRQQVELLRSRGMAIGNISDAEAALERVGYYRLSGYWYPYRVISSTSLPTRLDEFKPGTTLGQVVSLYEFDRKLKLLALDCIERIEVSMRVRISYTLGLRDSFAHLDAKHLDGRFLASKGGGRLSSYNKWRERIQEAQARSTEDFVQHFQTKYGGLLPIWVATEIMDFGLLSTLYAGLKKRDRDQIARGLGVVDSRKQGNGAVLTNWMRVLNYTRNVCAHHSRLWNRNITVQVATKNLGAIPELKHLQGSNIETSRVYSVLAIIRFLLRDISPDFAFTAKLGNIIELGLDDSKRNLSEMGFPVNWDRQNLWRT